MLEPRVRALEALLTAFSVEDGGRTLRLTGMNLQIVSGAGSTDADPNGLGNLIVGYDEPALGECAVPTAGSDGFALCRTDADCAPNRCSQGTIPTQCTVSRDVCIQDTDCDENYCIFFDDQKSGSHNVVVGGGHGFRSFGGVVSGTENVVAAPGASAVGGRRNQALGPGAAVVAGDANLAVGSYSGIHAGERNLTTGRSASVNAGRGNEAKGSVSSITGGSRRIAEGEGQTLGAARLWAVLDETGTLRAGQHVVSAGRDPLALGQSGYYQVTFDRDVRGCAHFVSKGDETIDLYFAVFPNETGRTLRIQSLFESSHGLVLFDTPVHVQVVCP